MTQSTIPRWLFENTDPLSASWFFDAPWGAASERYGHELITRTSQGLARSRVALARHAERDVLRQVLYGNPMVDPHQMMGLTAMFDTSNVAKAQNAVNTIDAGDTNACGLSSFWVIGWGPRTVYMVSPDGEPPCIQGECAIVVADWRYVLRVANINSTFTKASLIDLMVMAILRAPVSLTNSDRLRPIIYMNKDIHNQVKDQLGDVSHFRGYPIRVITELVSDEDHVA